MGVALSVVDEVSFTLVAVFLIRKTLTLRAHSNF